jgi:peptide/nickel transport system substrate-binding protein
LKPAIILLIILVLLLVPKTAPAQEPGSGGTIVVGFPGGTTALASLNPLRSADSSTYYTYRVAGLMFPTVIGVSPFTQYYARVGEKGMTNALATDWTISADGLVYTLTLRRDAVWSDGVPITATDVKFSFDAVASGMIESPLYGGLNYDPLANPVGIQEIVVVDDYTLQVVFKETNCSALGLALSFPVVPAHVFGYDGRPDFDFSVMVGHEFDTQPSVVYGPFQLDYVHYGEEIALKPVPTWADGPVVPAGLVLRDVSDSEDETRRFLAGEFDYIENPISCMSCRADIRAAPDVKAVSFPGLSWDYLALNVADPENPQPGEDGNGNRIDQGHHPLFGDVRVRRALQLAINVPDIIQGALFGEGTQMASSLLPTSWASDPDLVPIPYDPAQAARLLDEAGWPLGPNGIRICQGCQYAEDGTPFEFELVTNEGNTRREAVGQIVQDQLADLGIVVDFWTGPFSALGPIAQTLDAYILGWLNGFPDDPDQLGIFGPGSDSSPDQGSMNASSYYDPEFNRLSEKARTLPGCDPADRADIYGQIDRLLQADQPYLWLFAQNDLYAAHTDVAGFDPQPHMPWWNIHTWQVPGP